MKQLDNKNTFILICCFIIGTWYYNNFIKCFTNKIALSCYKGLLNFCFLKKMLFSYYNDSVNLNKLLKKQSNSIKLHIIINNYLPFLIILNYQLESKVPVYTMMSLPLAKNLEYHIRNTNKVKGDLVDVGVWRGGSSMIMQYYKEKNKKVFLLDLFDHMNSVAIISNNNDLQYKGDQLVINYLDIVSKYFKRPAVKTSIKQVKQNFIDNDLPLNNVEFIKGNLNDPLFEYHKIKNISLLRIDCDFYLPTLNVLKNLYSKVSKNGVIIFDDFNLPLLGERRAALDFFQNKNIDFISVGQSAYMIKQ